MSDRGESCASFRSAGDALDKIFTGILGLTGTAVGFYFGAGGTANDNK